MLDTGLEREEDAEKANELLKSHLLKLIAEGMKTIIE
ncbi:MAG: hypothetical protein FD147_2544 [Chloroflexi bacterium]|nr:MAG: hypothetical protein FD147_2544 [Chloroflexota bacterium]